MKKMCSRDQIKDEKILSAYDQYKNYISELNVYEEYRKGLNRGNIIDLYKKNGFNVKNKKEVMSRFEAFASMIEAIKVKSPKANLKDISTQQGRNIVSKAIRETRGR